MDILHLTSVICNRTSLLKSASGAFTVVYFTLLVILVVIYVSSSENMKDNEADVFLETERV